MRHPTSGVQRIAEAFERRNAFESSVVYESSIEQLERDSWWKSPTMDGERGIFSPLLISDVLILGGSEQREKGIDRNATLAK